MHSNAYSADVLHTFVVEIPMFETAKMEVSKEDVYNPIKQDTNKDGSPRYYTCVPRGLSPCFVF